MHLATSSVTQGGSTRGLQVSQHQTPLPRRPSQG
uniref:Uncharacterized protein n=1 Tax=Anguilla anguilla TaxID=7936 RepID=A0A0E9VIF3_ANGAN